MGVRDFAKQRKEKMQAAYTDRAGNAVFRDADGRQALSGVRAYAAQKSKNADAVVRPIDTERAAQTLFDTSEAGRAARFYASAKQQAEKEKKARADGLRMPVTPGETAKLWVADRQNGTKLLDEKQGQKHHIDMMSYDVDAAKAQLEELKKQGGSAAAGYITAPGDLVVDGGKIKTKAEVENAAAQHELEREIEEVERYQKAVGYAELPNRPDFAEKSKRTTANNRYDKAVYNDGWYSDKQQYIDDLKPKYRAEYEKILAENGEAEADEYLMRFYNDEGGYFQKYLEELSDDEKSIFNYILNTEGDEKAEEYLKFLDQTLTYRSAVRNYERAKEMSGVEQHLYGFFNDIDSGIANAGQGVLSWLTDEEIPYTREQMENSMFLQDQDGFSSLVHRGITSSANMLPSLFVGTVSPAAGKALFFASAGGGARQEALRDGYTAAQATRYGMLNGAAEVFLESVLGGVVQLGGKGLSNVLGKIPGAKEAVGKIGNVLARISVGKQSAARFAAHTLDNLGGEFTDEYLQEILDPVFRNICLGEHNEFKPFTEEALLSGLVGALMAANSGMLNLPADIYDARMSSKEAFKAQRMRDVSNILIENTSGIQREDVVKAREVLKQKVDNHESIGLGDIADYAKTLQEGELMRGFGVADTVTRTESDIRAQLGDAANGDAVAAALYGMQKGEFSERDAETVRNSPEGRALFSEYFDTGITENTSVDEISAAVRDVSGDDYRSISYEAQQLLKSVRASNGYSDGADAAFYRAYFEGFSGKARSDSKILSNAALEAAYQMGADAKNDVGTFHTVGNATISKEATAFLSRAAKDLGLSITYGGKGSVANGGVVDGTVRRDVRRGYSNSYRGIHIYEDAKVQEVGGKTLVGGDAAARIILGHELTHVLQNQSPVQYKAFENLVLSQTSEKSISIYMETLNKSREDAIDEIVADYAMTRMFSDMKTAREVTKHHSKVAEAIRSAFAWIREKLGIRTSEVDRAAAMWNKAYNESRRNADAAVADAANRAKGVANSAETSYNGVKNSIAQNNAKLIRYFTGEVRESGDVYLSDRDKAKIAHNVKSGNGWMNESTSSGYVYTDMCFYTFEFNPDRSITVTRELFIEDDAGRIKTIRREFSSNGNKATVRGNDSAIERKELQAGISAEYSVPGDSGRGIGRVSEVHGQAPGGGRLRTDNGSGQNHEKPFATSEKQNKVKADSAESAFSVGKVKDSIAGPRAKTADVGRLELAQRMIEDGMDSETVRRETGWYRGYDGKWRFEIDDSKMRFINRRDESRRTWKLDELIRHDALFAAYPELRNYTVLNFAFEDGVDGVFSTGLHRIMLNPSLDRAGKRAALIHEIQHAIQVIEGFAAGSSTDYWQDAFVTDEEIRTERHLLELSRKNRLLEEDMYRLLEDTPDARRDALRATLVQRHGEKAVREFTDTYNHLLALQKQREMRAERAYRDTAGEIEAADVASRLGLSAKQRAETRPDIDRTNVRFSNEHPMFTMEARQTDENITADDLQAIRAIGRKSINDFTSDDVRATEKWARKFYRELGTKSPFFRAWFGDWRAEDTSPVSVVAASDTQNKTAGKTQNRDTGMTISWSSALKGETKNHAVKDRIAVQAVNDIAQIVQNAVYLDTESTTPTSKSKMPGTAFMHSFYTLYKAGGSTYLLKMYVEEAISSKDNAVFDRAYQLKDIEKVASVADGVLSENGGLTEATHATTYSISDLYALVKQYDKDFKPKAVSPALLNEDGTPKVVYYGTNSEAFTVFDSDKSGRVKKNVLGDGYYFAAEEKSATHYGEHVMPVYLDIKNPYKVYAREGGMRAQMAEDFNMDANAISRGDIQSILKANGYDGVLLYSSKYAADGDFSTAVVFDNTQIKSATDNVGTFDSENPDIRYSTSLSDYARIVSDRIDAAARGRQTSVSEVLRRNEKEARDVKREFLPDMKTVGEVAHSFAELGLAEDATAAGLVKATTDAAVAMRAAYLERRIANEATKDAKSRTASKKLLKAAEMVKLPDGMSKTQVAAAMADALYQTNTSDRKTVKELVAQYGAIKPGEKPSRTLSVPKRTDEGRNVSAAVRTVLEARVTPDGMVPTIEDAIESGDFSYETITDKASLARAKSKIRRGYQEAYDDFRDAARNGIVSKDQFTLGLELYNQAANSGTADGARQAMDILSDIVSTSRSSAQTLAAMRLLKKMSPEGQLYTVEKTISRINESIGTRKKRQLNRARSTVDDAMWSGRADAAEEMARSLSQMGHFTQMTEEKSRAARRDNGLPVEDWVDAIGNLVGDGIAARLSPKTKAERLVSQNIRNDLLKFAEDYLPRAAGERKSKTAAERLADYFANKDNYEKAWERAKASIREKYANNPDALAQLDAFLVGTLSYGDVKGSSVMMSAIAKAAISEDGGIRQLALRANLGDAEGVAMDIFNRLNKTVQASDTDAVVLRDAIRRYVHETAAEKATPQMVENEIRRAVREAGTTISEIIRSDTNERAAVLRRIQSYLIENLGISADSAQTAADMIQKHFTQMTEEKSRAALEAALKDKPRSVRKTAEERFREYANLGAFEGEYNEAISKKLFGETVKVNEKLAQAFLAAETEEQRTEILKDIYRDIGRQVPSTWLEKWTAWRYLSMLFNPTTHIRNVVGNAGFAPIVMAKNKVAWLIESGYGAFNKDFEKTKAILVGHGDLVKAADADFLKYQETLFDGGKYRDEVNANKYIDEGHKSFKNKVLQGAYDFNSWALSAEDMVFKRQYYGYALASWCKAHGITAEQIRRGEGLDAARAYAIREAQRNTYNDANAFSDLLSRRSDKAAVNVFVSAIMPFRRTPANILARGLEYSPAGLLWTATRGTYQLRNGEISVAQYIDNMAQGLTGTGILALGAFLAHLGIIGFGGDDDKEKDFEKMYGHQQYSIEIGGKSITLDWLAPESIPFFTGVNIYELMRDGGFSFEDMQQVLELVTDPMLNMSMLQGLNDMIENAKWSPTNAVGSVLFGIAESLISQNLPTVLGKFERITQPDRMTTYVDKNQPLWPSAQKTLGKLSQKVPGLDYNQIPYIDAWGAKETNTNAAWRAFDQLMNPAYTATVDATPLEQEIIRLHRATGENDMFPTRAQKSFTVKRRKDGKPLVGGETKDEVEAVDFNLTADQYVKYATYRGKASKRIAEALIKSPYYKQADDATQRDLLAYAYDIADAEAKMLVSDYRPEGWVAKAVAACKETGITEMQYITLYMQQNDIDSLSDGEKVSNLSSARKMQMLNKATLSDAQRARLADDFKVGKKVRGWREKDIEKFLSWYKEG